MTVSIIIPVYNVSPYIKDCLKSVMHQTYTGDMECLLVDDCGTDDSIDVAESMIAGYDGLIRFEILHHERNRGLPAARNTGNLHARGDYIYYLDSDDEITQDCIEKLMKVVSENPSVDMVQGTHITHNKGKQIPVPREILVPHAHTNDEVRNCYFRYDQFSVVAWDKLIKAALVRQNHLSFVEGLLFEDTPWTFHLIKHVREAVFLPDITYHYKRHADSIVTGTTKEIAGIHHLKGFHEIVTHFTPSHEKEEWDYYVNLFAGCFACYSHLIPEYSNDILIFRNMAKRYKEYKMYIILTVCYIFRKYSWERRVYSLLTKIMNPQKTIEQVYANRKKIMQFVVRKNCRYITSKGNK